jgi:NADH:ubiquinone oxidoreductase subunit 6 (subunit J)
MSDLQIFALIGILVALAATVFIPQAARVAPLSVANIFGMVTGLLAASMGFLAFTTDWHDQDAWRSGALLATGIVIACYMMKRCTRHYWQTGE